MNENANAIIPVFIRWGYCIATQPARDAARLNHLTGNEAFRENRLEEIKSIAKSHGWVIAVVPEPEVNP